MAVVGRLLALCLLVAAAPAAAGNPLLPGIKGADDRVVLPNAEYPWSAIGRLNKRTGGFCTGVLVGPRKVLTAAHCLWHRPILGILPPESIHFLAGYSRGDHVAHAKAVHVEAAPGYDGRTPGALANLQKDWAIVTLDTDLSGKAGFVPVLALDREQLDRRLKAGAVFVQAGYSQDKAQILTANLGCPIDGFATGRPLVVHQCDTARGDSGSPLFLFDGREIRVAAMHVATGNRKDTQSQGLALAGSIFARHAGQADGGAPPGEPRVTETAALLLTRLGHPPSGDLAAATRTFERRLGLPETGKPTYGLVGRMITELGKRKNN